MFIAIFPFEGLKILTIISNRRDIASELKTFTHECCVLEDTYFEVFGYIMDDIPNIIIE